MEKTKKLFAYVVAFVAIVTLFVAGISVQSTLSYAKSSTEQDGEFTSATATVNGVAVGENDIELVFDNNDATQSQKAELANDNAVVKGNNLSATVKEQLAEIAKTYDAEADSAAMDYSDAFIVELKGAAAAADEVKVEFDLEKVPGIQRVEFALFKATGSDEWQVLLPVEENAAANATNKNGGSKISFNVPGSGTIIFGQYSQAKADQIKAEKANESCCSCCSKDCPFCSFLCKDGKCYCWTMYLVIALAAILLVLVIVLIIVKIKAKKVVDVQEEPVVVEPAEEAPVQQQEAAEETEEENK